MGPRLRRSACASWPIGAFVSLTMFAFTTVPWNWMALHQSEWPEDIQKRTYFTQGLCGEDTSYACAGPDKPIPTGNDSIHLGPDGSLVVPEGTEIKKTPPVDRGPLGPEGD